MKVTIEGNTKEDFPNESLKDATLKPRFIAQIKSSVKRHLALRDTDTIILIIDGETL